MFRDSKATAVKESEVPLDPSVSRLNCLFTARVTWAALFTAGVFSIYGLVTSAIEKISEDFIKKHMTQFQVSLLFLIVGFFALVLCLYFNGLSGLFSDTLGNISLYLLYAGVVVWCVVLFAHNSKGLEISLDLIFLVGPILVLLVILGLSKLELSNEEDKIRVLVEPVLQSINQIMSNYKYGDPLADEDHQYILVNVFNHHPQKVSEFAGRIKHFVVGLHPIVRETRAFFVVSTEGQKENFSHLTCLKNFAKEKFPDELVDAYFEKVRTDSLHKAHNRPKHKGTAGHVTPTSHPSKKPDAKTAANRSNQKRPADHDGKNECTPHPSKKPDAKTAANKSNQKRPGGKICTPHPSKKPNAKTAASKSNQKKYTNREGLMSYEQFVQGLEDDILPSEAERRYQKYMSDSTPKQAYFDAHQGGDCNEDAPGGKPILQQSLPERPRGIDLVLGSD